MIFVKGDHFFRGQMKLLFLEYSERTLQEICLVGRCLNPISSFFTEMWALKFGVQKLQNFEYHQKQIEYHQTQIDKCTILGSDRARAGSSQDKNLSGRAGPSTIEN